MYYQNLVTHFLVGPRLIHSQIEINRGLNLLIFSRKLPYSTPNMNSLALVAKHYDVKMPYFSGV